MAAVLDEHARNSLRRYESVLGSQPKPQPHVRGSPAGFHIDKLWPELPFEKEPIPGAQPTQHYAGLPQPVRSLQVADIEGASPGVLGRAGGPGWPSQRRCVKHAHMNDMHMNTQVRRHTTTKVLLY